MGGMTNSTAAPTLPATQERAFQRTTVLAVALAHLVHDTYPAFLAPLIPLLTDKLGLSLTLAGSLVLVMRGSSVIQPFIGYLADRTELRYFIILAPAFTAIFMSALGLASSYVALVPLLFLTGVSTAMFHAPAPAMVTRVSGRQLGKGMSVFMAGGELGRTAGPLFIVLLVDRVGLHNAYLAAVPGALASIVLYRMLRSLSEPLEAQSIGTLAALSNQRRPLLLLLGLNLVRAMSVFSFAYFLPTYLSGTGSSLVFAGGAVSAFELAGVIGALAGGTLSDRFGRRTMLFLSQGVLSPVLFLFLRANGLVTLPLLMVGGLIALATGPIGLTVVQELFTENRGTATGIYISFSMLSAGIATTAFGAVADAVGLTLTMHLIALIPLLGAPLVWLLPETRGRAG
jgi:FSR family fosmidomycin resistance protein-like MFS transporter